MSGMVDLINSFMREEARREKQENKEWAADLVLEQETVAEIQEPAPVETKKEEENKRASRTEQLWAGAWAAAMQKPKEKKKRKGKKEAGSD